MSNKPRNYIAFFFAAWALAATAYILYENPHIEEIMWGPGPVMECQFEHIAGKYAVRRKDIHTTKSLIMAKGRDNRVHMFRTQAMFACQEI